MVEIHWTERHAVRVEVGAGESALEAARRMGRERTMIYDAVVLEKQVSDRALREEERIVKLVERMERGRAMGKAGSWGTIDRGEDLERERVDGSGDAGG